jgi:hypothetical protein
LGFVLAPRRRERMKSSLKSLPGDNLPTSKERSNGALLG